MEEHEKIELRSDEVQEILGTPPRWIVRWGTTFIFLGIILLGVVSYIIKYPDVVAVPMYVTTYVEPVEVVAQKSGHLAKLMVEDNESVIFGQILVEIQNQANLEDVLALDSITMELQNYELEELLDFVPPTKLNVGSLQSGYSRFIQLYRDLADEISSGYTSKRLATLNSTIKNIKSSIASSKRKLEKAQVEFDIADKKVAYAQKLYQEGLKSRQVIEDASAVRASLDRQIQAIRGEIIEKGVSISQIENQKVEIGTGANQKMKNKFVELQEIVNKLRTSIGAWKEVNLLLSPIEGRVALSADYRSAQQFIKSGDRVMAIVPKAGDRILGKAQLPSSALGKVNLNDKVIIRLDAYPYEEFGSLIGKLESKSALPNRDKLYPIHIELDQGLISSTGKALRFDQQMTGVAEIITKERRFIERIFDTIRKLFDKY